MKEIKLRGTELKHENTTNRVIGAAERAKELAGRTADQAQDLSGDEQASSSAYAGDRLQHGMGGVAIEAGHIVVDAGKMVYRAGKAAVRNHQIKREDIDPEASKPESYNLGNEEPQVTPQKKVKTERPRSNSQNRNAKADQPSKAQCGRTVKESNRDIKLSQRGVKKTADGAQKTAKTAEQTSKTAAKTAKGSAEAAKKTVQGTAKAAKKTAEAVKATGKALVAAGKAVVAGMKSLVAAIIAGGWISVLIIVIAMLLALFVAAFGGVFLPEEGMTTTTIASLEPGM